MDDEDDGWRDLWESEDERASTVQKTHKAVRFQAAEVIAVPSWNEETRVMNCELPPSPAGSELIHRICSVDICEVFSPPRVVREARRYGLSVGEAMDLTTGWDFTVEAHRRKAE